MKQRFDVCSSVCAPFCSFLLKLMRLLGRRLCCTWLTKVRVIRCLYVCTGKCSRRLCWGRHTYSYKKKFTVIGLNSKLCTRSETVCQICASKSKKSTVPTTYSILFISTEIFDLLIYKYWTTWSIFGDFWLHRALSITENLIKKVSNGHKLRKWKIRSHILYTLWGSKVSKLTTALTASNRITKYFT